jgi:hypothetical protein
MNPVEVDGLTAVILRQCGERFERVCAGRLAFDGSELSLMDSDDRESTVISEEALAGMMHVTSDNRIPECSGFDLFIIARS